MKPTPPAETSRSTWIALRQQAFVACVATTLSIAFALPATACVGDCDADGRVLVDELIRGVNIALGTDAVDTCFALDRDFDGGVTVDEVLAAVNAALVGCPPQERAAFVIATDFETGSFATVDLATRQVTLPAAPARRVNADAVARLFDDRVYVVNRFGLRGDSIQVLDPTAGFTTLSDCSTGARSNPQDIAFASPTKAYVTRYESTELLIVNPSVGADCAGFVRGTIDLAAFADSDGIPEMERLALADGILYVSLQRLGRNNLFEPMGNGIIVAIDTATDEIRNAIELQGANPFGPLVVRGDRLFVSTVGRFTQNDGGIEEVDLRSGTSLGWRVSEAALGGDISDFVLVSERLGFAVVSGADFRNALVEFSPHSGTRTRTLFAESSFLAQLRVTEAGDLYVADRSFQNPGLRIFDVRSGNERPGSPLDLGLPPFDVVFLR